MYPLIRGKLVTSEANYLVARSSILQKTWQRDAGTAGRTKMAEVKVLTNKYFERGEKCGKQIRPNV